MKTLTRDEMKKIVGGYMAEGGGDKSCETNADCGSKNVNCNGQEIPANGICRTGKCYWAVAC